MAVYRKLDGPPRPGGEWPPRRSPKGARRAADRHPRPRDRPEPGGAADGHWPALAKTTPPPSDGPAFRSASQCKAPQVLAGLVHPLLQDERLPRRSAGIGTLLALPIRLP